MKIFDNVEYERGVYTVRITGGVFFSYDVIGNVSLEGRFLLLFFEDGVDVIPLSSGAKIKAGDLIYVCKRSCVSYEERVYKYKMFSNRRGARLSKLAEKLAEVLYEKNR